MKKNFLFNPHAQLFTQEIKDKHESCTFFYEALITTLYIKLTTDADESSRYFFLVNYNDYQFISEYTIIANPLETAFDNSITNPGILTCHIHCKSVEIFTIEYGDKKQLDLFSELYQT